MGKEGQQFQVGEALKGGLASSMDPNNNLIVAAAFGCIPGVITGLDKFRQVRCLYADCLINAVGKDGLPLKACEDQKSYAYCKYITGELFAIFPYTAVFDYMTGLVKNALTNPFELIGVAAAAACRHTCGSFGPGEYIACETVKLMSQIGQVSGSIKGLYKEGFKSRQDYCSRLDLGDDETAAEDTGETTAATGTSTTAGTSGATAGASGTGTATGGSR